MEILRWVWSWKLKGRLEAALFKVSSAMAVGRAAAEFGSDWRCLGLGKEKGPADEPRAVF